MPHRTHLCGRLNVETSRAVCRENRGSERPRRHRRIYWGPERVRLYDDAGIPIMGAKHPHEAMGPLREVFPDLWPHLEPMFEEIERTGRATWAEAQLLPIVRSGFLEEVYFTWSYSPVRDESGAVVGFYTPAVEATGQVLGQRRLRTLHAITHRAIGADSVEDAGRAALSALAENAADVPFALLYLADAQGERASLLGACGVDPRASGAPERVDLREGSAGDKAGWLLGPVARSRQAA
ncbi:MAG TPA: hypothetical protein VFS00_03180, partial [Polyangiaceae bacterium]|nr:hypothetical protein [Polyangiaceae bacterium]